MATMSGWNSTKSSSSRSPSDPVPRFQSSTARSTGWRLAYRRADSASGTPWTWTFRPDDWSQSRNVLRTGSSSSTTRMVSDMARPGGLGFVAARRRLRTRPPVCRHHPRSAGGILERGARIEAIGEQFPHGRFLGGPDLDQDRPAGGEEVRHAGGDAAVEVEPVRPAGQRGSWLEVADADVERGKLRVRNIRRIADDQVERLAGDRVEQVALEERDAVGDAVPLGVRRGDGQGDRTDVDGGNFR